MQNDRLYSQIEQALADRTQEVELLLDASTLFSTARNLGSLLDLLARKLAQSVGTTFCRVALLDENAEILSVRAFFALHDIGLDAAFGRKYRLADMPTHQRVVSGGEPLLLLDLQADKEAAEPERSLLFGFDPRSVLIVPLAAKDRIYGIAHMGEMRRPERSSFTKAKVQICRALARQGALAIENILTLESIEYQRQRTQLIIDNVADGVFRADSRGEILTFNPAAEKITGYTRAEAVGQNCSNILQGVSLDGERRCEATCPLVHFSAPTDDREPIDYKEWITCRDGAKKLIHHTVSPYVTGFGQVAGTVSVIRDISLEEELVRIKSELVSLICHELRTPLASISASTELLAGGNMDPAARDALIQVLNRQCTRLMRLADDVLDASRLEKGRIELVLEPLALIPLIEETIAMFQSEHPRRQFIVLPPPERVFALGNVVSVGVVLENLIRNAINYSPEGSPITVSVQNRDADIKISVMDHGAGIPPEQLNLLFQKFRRLQPGSGPGGFGLGLYVAKTLLEAQGGKIWAESEPGKGSRFSFALPRLEDLDETQDTDY